MKKKKEHIEKPRLPRVEYFTILKGEKEMNIPQVDELVERQWDKNSS